MLSRDGPESRAFGGKNITNLTEALSGWRRLFSRGRLGHVYLMKVEWMWTIRIIIAKHI